MARATRYVVFNPAARGSLLQALKSENRPGDVAAMFDDLRCGPIEPFDPDLREHWLNSEADYGLERCTVRVWHNEFWTRALDPDRRLVALTTRRSAGDWIGYLAWLALLGDTCAEVIDVSDVFVEGIDWQGVRWSGRRPIAHLPPDVIVRHGLIDMARPITADERQDRLDEWRRLGRENGAVRAILDGRTVSLPIDTFDDALLAAATSGFRNAARLIGDVLAEMDLREDWSTGDLLLVARLRRLVISGRLAAKGDVSSDVRDWEVRLP